MLSTAGVCGASGAEAPGVEEVNRDATICTRPALSTGRRNAALVMPVPRNAASIRRDLIALLSARE